MEISNNLRILALYKNTKNMKNVELTRKEAATIMTQTEKRHQFWWASPKNEKASKEFLKAREIYKERVKEENENRN